mgnify:CR=1 FL=1
MQKIYKISGTLNLRFVTVYLTIKMLKKYILVGSAPNLDCCRCCSFILLSLPLKCSLKFGSQLLMIFWDTFIARDRDRAVSSIEKPKCDNWKQDKTKEQKKHWLFDWFVLRCFFYLKNKKVPELITLGHWPIFPAWPNPFCESFQVGRIFCNWKSNNNNKL